MPLFILLNGFGELDRAIIIVLGRQSIMDDNAALVLEWADEYLCFTSMIFYFKRKRTRNLSGT